jgi:transcriptional regulator with XRE-family HTH domain
MQAMKAEIVKTLMAEHVVTRSALCQRAGVSPSYLSRILNGKVLVTDASLVKRLAAALGAEPERLLGSGAAAPVRVAVSPHLWSAPLLNTPGGAGHGDDALFTVLEGDPSATGHEALTRLRRGTAEVALAFETPLNMTEAADVLTLGSICAGTDHVRLLVHRRSPLLRRFEELLCGGAAQPGAPPPPAAERSAEWTCKAPSSGWLEAPTISLREETIVGDFLQQLEDNIGGFESIRPVAADAARPWLGQEGDPIHAILTWEPIASAVIAASGRCFIDIFADFAGRLPTRVLPRFAEYRVLLSRHRPLPSERLHEVVRGLADATRAMNHLSGKSRVILKSQPVIGRLADTLPFPLPAPARDAFCDLIAERLARTRFQVRLWPEAVTSGLL